MWKQVGVTHSGLFLTLLFSKTVYFTERVGEKADNLEINEAGPLSFVPRGHSGQSFHRGICYSLIEIVKEQNLGLLSL